jgi:hypothetical protein
MFICMPIKKHKKTLALKMSLYYIIEECGLSSHPQKAGKGVMNIMKRSKILTMITVAALFAGVFAQQGAGTNAPAATPGPADTTRTIQPRASQPQPQPSMNKVQRPTQQTNWSKIKTMFQ